MLVLLRKPGQQIRLDDDIVITILEVSGDRVKVGIEAPKDVRISRPEAEAQLTEENLLAASGRPRLRIIVGGRTPAAVN
jgi:carbon storage regulator